MTTAQPQQPTTKLWSRRTSILLIGVGVALAIASLAIVFKLGPLPWHPDRNAELSVTYNTYLKSGVLLIKPTGSGSPGVQAPTAGPLAAAAWDDDPGSYIIASLLGPVLGLKSPYPGLMLTEGLLVALGVAVLPTAVARVFKNAWAGFALIALPLVVWLCNHGAPLIGTEYGLSDKTSPLPVYALYGIPASIAFLSLSLILLLSTFRLRLAALIGITLLIGALAGFDDLSRSLSGIGSALCVGVLWWLNSSRKWRWMIAVLAAGIAVVLAVGVQNGVMAAINVTRVEATGQTLEEIPTAHAVWHSVYLGLSYPGPITGAPSDFDVTWADNFAWARAREVDPNVVIDSAHYDKIIEGLYWKKVSANPFGAIALYTQKLGYVLWHFAAMIAVILAGVVVMFLRRRRMPHRKAFGGALAIGVPTLVLGLIPPVLVMPLLYYFVEVSAGLSLFLAISLGALAWLAAPHVSRVVARRRRRTSTAVTV